MARTTMRFELKVEGAFVLNESEMRALDGLTGYGDDAFLKVFKENLGAYYIRDHEEGLRSFFKAVRREVIPVLGDIDRARSDLIKAHEARLKAAHPPAPGAVDGEGDRG